MIIFPNCKINLGLNISNKRNDGYHDLETIFHPAYLRDAVEIIENKNFQFTMSGIFVEGEIENNLCVKAYQLLKKDFPQLPTVQIHLHKAIPIGAGLGGGSADGAFTLHLLNKKFNLGLTEKQLLHYALQLGSDCPFFILNKTCFAAGRGEMLEPITLELSAFKFFIVHPGIHINTAGAYSNIHPAIPSKSLKEVIQQPISTWKDDLKNDFETPIFAKYPEIKRIKEILYEAGAIYASLTGSGSAVYGVFEKNFQIKYSFPVNYFVKEVNA